MTENGKPKYFTLMEELKEEILSGQIQPGEKLPSENQLTEKYSLSRHTVRKAIALLEREGYVEAYHGKGTLLLQKNAAHEEVQKYCSSDHLYFRLYFPKADPGNG